jgi:hypothetical protein
MAYCLTILPLCCFFVNLFINGQEASPPAATSAPHTIRFFFKPLLQESVFDIPQQAILAYLGSPEKLDRAVIREKMAAQMTSGIKVSYAGILTTSDFNGEVIFPRLHEADSITLIISEVNIPQVRHGVTAESWSTIDPQKSTWLSITRIRDEDLKKSFWNVEQIPPKNHIPRHAIVILNHPFSIVIQEGVYFAEEGPHLILPDIYVTPDINVVKPAARIVPYNRFFAPLRSWTAYTPERSALLAV